MTDEKPRSQWKEDRFKLRKYVEYMKQNKIGGKTATIVFALISQMREKIHMRYYMKYHCGGGLFGGYSSTSPMPPPCKKLVTAYKDFTDRYHKMVYIGSLEDQHAWLSSIRMSHIPEELREIVKRVLEGYPKEEMDAAITPLEAAV